ncbi:Lrp/AsnC family transcriptional regulator [Propioniciclava coleopterorum]|uniref:Lrp/AsnC family transcriptional regulator n=1 Tax=Propioniciclava coleopterorum TaxID=2714937 RepID=A0A6G7Y7Y2_9ACTN|nr:Lrp/AsnC ligand binding domain-containing protein [Propioniciclava coleopterorum]QIK72925.1 Lrp/AsnC family transcriptional regulator [Propioniciclava coleopterorum]
MNTAIVFITTQVDQVSEVADRVAAMPEVTEVYSVTGDMDLIALVRTREIERIADVVTGGINKVPGVTGTQTHLAFRAYSTHDLEAAFSLGE